VIARPIAAALCAILARPMRIAAARTTILLALVTLTVGPAGARTFQVSEVEGTANVELS